MSAAPRLSVEVHDGDGPPIFLLHGMLSSRLQWRANLAALARVARPVVFELWGHGRSPAPADPAEYAVARYVDEFERVRTELGAQRVFVCGQSFGAGPVLRYALDHPARVIGAVFTNSLSALSPPGELAARRRASADDVETRGLPAIEAMPFHPRHATRLAPAVRDALVAAASAVDPRAVALAIRHGLAGTSVRDDLERIAVPTLLVNGLRERGFQPMRDEAARRIPGLEVVDLPAGHAVNLEDPAGFDAAATGFVARHRR